jgi:hypothetical protein
MEAIRFAICEPQFSRAGNAFKSKIGNQKSKMGVEPSLGVAPSWIRLSSECIADYALRAQLKTGNGRAVFWLTAGKARRGSMAVALCDRGATLPGVSQKTALRVADLWRCCCVARRSKIHKGYSPSSRLAAAPNLWQRARSLS